MLWYCLQWTTLIMLAMIMKHVYLLKLLLECQDGHTWNDHMRYYSTCHFPNVGGQIDPSLIVVPIGPWCMLCM